MRPRSLAESGLAASRGFVLMKGSGRSTALDTDGEKMNSVMRWILGRAIVHLRSSKLEAGLASRLLMIADNGAAAPLLGGLRKSVRTRALSTLIGSMSCSASACITSPAIEPAESA